MVSGRNGVTGNSSLTKDHLRLKIVMEKVESQIAKFLLRFEIITISENRKKVNLKYIQDIRGFDGAISTLCVTGWLK